MQTSLTHQQVFQRWYALYVRHHHAKCVAAHFSVKSIEYFLPTYTEVHKWKNGCRMQLDLPLFPGYLFARILLSQRSCVLECPGVIRFGAFNRDLSPVDDCDIESLRLGLQRYFVRPHPYLRVGTRLRVRRGPFEGRTGTLVREQGRIRAILSMDLLKRAIAVELDLADVDVIPVAATQELDIA